MGVEVFVQVYLLLTSLCNLNCKMCIRSDLKFNTINFDSLSQVFNNSCWKNDDFVLTGGEPTLHKDFIKCVNFFSEKAHSVAITTNGTTNYYIDKLKGLKNLMLQISLDGDQQYHDSVRGENTFSKVKNTIDKLEKTNVNYCVASIVNRNNVDKIKYLIPFLSKLKKLKFWRLMYELPFGKADRSFMLSSSEWNNFVDSIIPLVPFKLLVKKHFAFDLYDQILKNEDKALKYKMNRIRNCGSCKRKIYIYPDFNVYPCTCLTDFPIGNLLKDNIQDIINSPAADTFINYKLDPNLPCNDCKYYEFCFGGCIGMSYHLLGKLGGGDIRCPKIQKYYNEQIEN